MAFHLTKNSNTVNIRKQNVRFGKPNVFGFGYRTCGFRTFGSNQTKTGSKPVWNWFCVWETERNRSDFRRSVRMQPNDDGNVRNMNVRISDVYCINQNFLSCIKGIEGKGSVKIVLLPLEYPRVQKITIFQSIFLYK